ncbi:MAG: trmE [Chlamydiales bacterium]|nr:trmE [Chlamydiales bacterium]
MEFIHEAFEKGQTIAAIATAPGDGAIGIIRIAGDASLEVAKSIFRGKKETAFKSHQLYFGQIVDGDEEIDEVLITVMHGKKSYSGETTVEIFCHGGSFICRRILELALKKGARLARPGEFTLKAFCNGKLDLAQAESVQLMISAKNERALKAARDQLQGRLSKNIAQIQRELTDIAAILDAWVDFPEEGLEFASMEEICQQLHSIKGRLKLLIASYHDGKIVSEGISLCLIGRPNVGKSSLMNALLDRERAIVSSTPGTTRDLIEADLRLKGIPIRLIDTAGIRESDESIEAEGIRRSKEAMERADLILYVLDASLGLQEEDLKLAADLPKERTIAIWNKMDLPVGDLPSLPFQREVRLSAKEGHMDLLKEAIDAVIGIHPPSKEELLITSERHFQALNEALGHLSQVIFGLESGVSAEFIAFDMRESLKSLGKIIGTHVGEDILSSIFKNFCIGK